MTLGHICPVDMADDSLLPSICVCIGKETGVALILVLPKGLLPLDWNNG